MLQAISTYSTAKLTRRIYCYKDALGLWSLSYRPGTSNNLKYRGRTSTHLRAIELQFHVQLWSVPKPRQYCSARGARLYYYEQLFQFYSRFHGNVKCPPATYFHYLYIVNLCLLTRARSQAIQVVVSVWRDLCHSNSGSHSANIALWSFSTSPESSEPCNRNLIQ